MADEPTVGDTLPAPPPGPATSAEPRLGDTVDRYVIESRLGAGGMGVVYRASDPALDRKVALKVLRPGAPAERLRREAQALAKLSHPNVVAVFDVGEFAGGTFIAMALVDGHNLRGWLDATTRDTASIVAVIRDAARGLVAAHEAGLVHRDLKPDNIFVSRDREVLVGDFGLAREAGDDEITRSLRTAREAAPPQADLTATGAMLGTPAYMAPEQAAGEATMASDQFSLCVTAWEALFGSRPFVGATHAELLDSIDTGEYAPIARTRTDVPAHVTRALRRGLASDPAKRFPSVAELLAALEPPVVTPRKRWPLIVMGCIAIGAIVIAVVVLTRHAEAVAAGPDCVPHQLDGWTPEAKAKIDASLGTSVATTLDARILALRTLRTELCTTATPIQDKCMTNLAIDLKRVLDDAPAATTSLLLYSIAKVPEDRICRGLRAMPPDHTDEYAAIVHEFAQLEMAHALGHVTSTDAVDALVARARIVGERSMIVDLRVFRATLAQDRGDNATAEAILLETMTSADAAHEDSERMTAAANLAQLYANTHRLPEAKRLLEEARAAWKRYGDPEEHPTFLQAEAAVALELKDYPTAIAAGHKILARAEAEHDKPEYLILQYDWLVHIYLAAGNLAEARATMAVADALRVKAGFTDDLLSINMKASTASAAGDFETAIKLNRQVVDRLVAQPPEVLGKALVDLGLLYEITARYADMIDTYGLAIRTLGKAAETDDLLGYRAIAFEGIGRGHIGLGEFKEAIDPLRESIATSTGKTTTDLVDAHQTATLALAEALLGVDKPHDVRALLEPILLALDKDPAPKLRRVGGASFSLARALWAEGTAKDRDRARVLAADAIRAYEATLAADAAIPQMAIAQKTLAERLAVVKAWQAKHP